MFKSLQLRHHSWRTLCFPSSRVKGSNTWPPASFAFADPSAPLQRAHFGFERNRELPGLGAQTGSLSHCLVAHLCSTSLMNMGQSSTRYETSQVPPPRSFHRPAQTNSRKIVFMIAKSSLYAIRTALARSSTQVFSSAFPAPV